MQYMRNKNHKVQVLSEELQELQELQEELHNAKLYFSIYFIIVIYLKTCWFKSKIKAILNGEVEDLLQQKLNDHCNGPIS